MIELVQIAALANITSLNSIHLARPHYAYAVDRKDALFHEVAFMIPHPPLKHFLSKNRHLIQVADVPKQFDWREYNMVGPVYKQGRCNSCFAMTSADQLDYWYKKKFGVFGVSPQTLLDCTHGGCHGGLMEDVFKWHGPYGSTKEYTGTREHCTRPKTGVTVDKYVVLSDLDGDHDIENKLASAVYKYGPIPVGIDATGSRFMTYRRGLINHDQCNKIPNHAVTVVGYTPSTWIVKNSWGTKWGMDGYAHIERGHNTCGISSYASFATSVH